MTRSLAGLAFGVLALGVCTLVFGDFLLQWQPVPERLPARAALAFASATVLIVGAAGLVWSRSRRFAAAGLAVYFLAWTVLLHGPKVVASPTSGVAWLGVAEILALACAAGLIALSPPSSAITHATAKAARIGFGASAVIFGLSHFIYLDFTAAMVPAWLPFPLAWAALTGAGHLAAGLAIMVRLRARLAGRALAAMCYGFALLLHLPRVIAAPSSRIEWTMLAVALTLAGAAWVVADWLAEPPRTTGSPPPDTPDAPVKDHP